MMTQCQKQATVQPTEAEALPRPNRGGQGGSSRNILLSYAQIMLSRTVINIVILIYLFIKK